MTFHEWVEQKRDRQLAAAKKQNVMLRTALDMIQWGDVHFDPTGYSQHCCPECGNLKRQAHAKDCPVGIALDATSDMAGYILCDAEPVAHMSREMLYPPITAEQRRTTDIPLYKAKG
jgi:hypothetical protein